MLTIESLTFAFGLTIIFMFVAIMYYWRGYNRATQAYSELLYTYEPEAFKRLKLKLNEKYSNEQR